LHRNYFKRADSDIEVYLWWVVLVPKYDYRASFGEL